jgi:hypothetical protein
VITPGKWEYTAALGEVFARQDDGAKQLAIVMDNDADGYLMAAAPELLAACELAEADVATCGGIVPILRAAIAKAKGES